MADKGEPITLEKDSAADRRDQRIAELEAEVEQTKAENARLKARIAQLKQRIGQLEQRVAELERAGNCAEGATAGDAVCTRRAQSRSEEAGPPSGPGSVFV